MAIKKFELRANLAQAIDDTVNAARSNAGALHVEIIAIKNIELDPDNPREFLINISDVINGLNKDDPNFKEKSIEIESLESLKKSLLNQGIINPITAYKYNDKYRVIAGERRTLASHLASIQQIPVRILSQKPNSLDLSLIQWVENMEREDLTLWERLKNIEKISIACIEEGKEFNATSLSTMLGCSRQLGTNYFVVFNSSNELKEAIKDNKIKNLEKSAIIARASQDKQGFLINKCIHGASPNELKKLSIENNSFTVKQSKETSKFNFGVTKNNNVAKLIMNAVIESLNDDKLNAKLENIDWSNCEMVNKSFKDLILHIESLNNK